MGKTGTVETTAALAADVAQADPVFKCEICGVEKATERALKMHRTREHGTARKTKASKCAPARTEVRTAGAVQAIFASVAAHLDETDAFTTACAEGLDMICGKMKALRLAYLKKADKLMKITAEVKRLKWEVRKLATADDETSRDGEAEEE